MSASQDIAKMKLLAELLKEKNKVDGEIARVIGRPTQLGHAGEYIAANIFGIELNESATQRGNDGYFSSSLLKGKSVNVKWYPKREGLLDINASHTADYYLVLTGTEGTLDFISRRPPPLGY